MITRDQLKIQIDRLCDTYGDKPFSAQREELIWEAIQGLEYAQVIKMVDEFIGRSRNAPLPNDFSEAAKQYTRKSLYALGEDRPHDQAKCQDCLDSGLIELERQPKYESWAKWAQGHAPCHCERGAEIIPAGKRRKNPVDFGPQFNVSWLESYRVKRKPKLTVARGPDDDRGGGDGGVA